MKKLLKALLSKQVPEQVEEKTPLKQINLRADYCRWPFCNYLHHFSNPETDDEKPTKWLLSKGLTGLALLSLTAVSIGVTSISVVGNTFVGNAGVLKSLARGLIPAGTFIYSFILSLDEFSTTAVSSSFSKDLAVFLGSVLTVGSMIVTVCLSLDLGDITTSFLKRSVDDPDAFNSLKRMNGYVATFIFLGPIFAGMAGLVCTRLKSKSVPSFEGCSRGMPLRILENLFLRNFNFPRVIVSMGGMLFMPISLLTKVPDVDRCLLGSAIVCYWIAKPLAEFFVLCLNRIQNRYSSFTYLTSESCSINELKSNHSNRSNKRQSTAPALSNPIVIDDSRSFIYCSSGMTVPLMAVSSSINESKSENSNLSSKQESISSASSGSVLTDSRSHIFNSSSSSGDIEIAKLTPLWDGSEQERESTSSCFLQ
ncbi:MAG: hypothetical protein JSR33_10035 [Proteobacteria bacterium]|nr:hypothetical protein [Pseudomonadota bacterium]